MTRESDVFVAFLIGVFVGGVGLGLLLTYSDSSTFRYNKAIVECEKSLPRDRHCIVIGVPEVNK